MSAAPDLATAPTAILQSGAIRGTVKDGIATFKGIPYGADTAKTRFKPPVKMAPWNGTRDCMDYGFKSPQVGGASVFGPDTDKASSEDCLYLNVWTPAVGDGGKRAVMVWLHGGGFTSFSGSSPAYDGVRQARRGDVVTVTINHRLGVVGYSYLADLLGADYKHSGNVGMMDIVLALEWVRDNIAAFGGDPSNVTIYGESGGGAKVSTLCAMPSAKGLFHKAIVMSGSSLQMRSTEAGTHLSKQYLEALGVSAEELPTLPLDKLMAPITGQTFRQAMNFAPVVDGDVLPRHPFDPDAPPVSADVPMLIGTCHDETTLLAGGRNPKLFELTWDTLPDELRKAFPNNEPDLFIAHYKKHYPDYSPSDVYFAATCDLGMFRGAIIQSERKQAAGAAPAFMYQFDYPSRRAGGKFKATHADEIVYVFDTFANYLRKPNPEGQKLADEMSESWIAFAKTGNPNNKAVPNWPAYDPKTRATMVFNVETTIVNDPRGSERVLFDQVPATRRG